MSNTEGICYLVGAGPGDPGLLTLRAREVIEQADIIFYDYLSNPAILSWAKHEAEKYYVGKQAGDHAVPQAQINDIISKHTMAGKRVVRLKGGDPFVFGRGGEEAQALVAAKVPFEVIPGISSVYAAAAYAGIPVTHRDHCSQLTVFTGHEDPDKEASKLDYQQLASAPGTKVLLMGVERIALIADQLMQHGMAKETPVAMIRWATTGQQQTLTATLADVADEVSRGGFKAPAVAVFGSVVNLRDELAWFEQRRPLLGHTVVVTRTRKQAGKLSAMLVSLGADVVELPVIRIAPPLDEKVLGEAVESAHEYDWIIFTSPNGVDAFFAKFFERYNDARCLGKAKIAAIGPATAKSVANYHLAVDLIPESYVAEEVVNAFRQVGGVENLKILLPRAEGARDVLPDDLEAMGGIVDRVVAYRTLPEELTEQELARVSSAAVNWITFTSSSTVENFLKLNLPWPPQAKAISIGPVTSATLKECGIEPAVEAKQFDIPGLVDALLAEVASSN